MPKKLVTVAWSYTVEVELPENTEADDLNDLMPDNTLAEIASDAVSQASNMIDWKDGVITDVQDA